MEKVRLCLVMMIGVKLRYDRVVKGKMGWC